MNVGGRFVSAAQRQQHILSSKVSMDRLRFWLTGNSISFNHTYAEIALPS